MHQQPEILLASHLQRSLDDPLVRQIVALLQEVQSGACSVEQANLRLRDVMPTTNNQPLLSFAESKIQGDVTLRDVAGRDIVQYNITINALSQNAPPNLVSLVSIGLLDHIPPSDRRVAADFLLNIAHQFPFGPFHVDVSSVIDKVNRLISTAKMDDIEAFILLSAICLPHLPVSIIESISHHQNQEIIPYPPSKLHSLPYLPSELEPIRLTLTPALRATGLPIWERGSGYSDRHLIWGEARLN